MDKAWRGQVICDDIPSQWGTRHYPVPRSDTTDTFGPAPTRIVLIMVAPRGVLVLNRLNTATETMQNENFSHVCTITQMSDPHSSNWMLQPPCDFAHPNTRERMRSISHSKWATKTQHQKTNAHGYVETWNTGSTNQHLIAGPCHINFNTADIQGELCPQLVNQIVRGPRVINNQILREAILSIQNDERTSKNALSSALHLVLIEGVSLKI